MTNGKFLHKTGSSTQRSVTTQGPGMGWRCVEVQERGTCVFLWLIHIVVWQKPTQPSKAIILQLKRF